MFISFLFLSYSILLISGVETELRYIGIGILLLINLIVIFVLRKMIKKKKIGRYILYFIILLILTVGQATLGYFVYKTYSSINNINKDKITYSTSLVVKTDSKIKDLNDLGLYGAITGKAIYANTLSLEEAIKVTKGEK